MSASRQEGENIRLEVLACMSSSARTLADGSENGEEWVAGSRKQVL